MSLSHNVYSVDDIKNKKKVEPVYIICNHNTLYEANNITDALDFCKSLHGFCSIFRRSGSLGKHWEFYVDVCGEEIDDVVA